MLTRQLFDWGAESHGWYRFLPQNVTSDPPTPEMEVYRAFANFSGGLKLPVKITQQGVPAEARLANDASKAAAAASSTASAVSEKISDSDNAADVQVEAVCVVGAPADRPPSCDHVKAVLVNGGKADVQIEFMVQSMANGTSSCSKRIGSVVILTPDKEGGQYSAVECDSTEPESIELPAESLVVIECRCA